MKDDSVNNSLNNPPDGFKYDLIIRDSREKDGYKGRVSVADRWTPHKVLKVVEVRSDEKVVLEYCCPNCIGSLRNFTPGYTDSGDLPKYCPFCGQALDWSDRP